jgi:hypothetical protein
MNKSDRERYLEALINPQTAIDWEMAAWDKRSPYNQAMMEMAIEGAAFIEILETLIMRRDNEFAKATSDNEQRLRDIYDEESTRFLRGQVFNTSPRTPRPEPTGKDFSLEASLASLEKRLISLREEIPGLEDTIKMGKKELYDIDTRWSERQAKAASASVEKLGENLAKIGIELPKLDDNDKKELIEAYKATSPAKILAVNPGLAANPDLNKNGMVQTGRFVHRLKCLAGVYRAVHKIDQDKDVNLIPSEVKKLDKLPFEEFTQEEHKDTEHSIGQAKVIASAQKRLTFIHSEEKLFNEFKNKLLAKNKGPVADITEEHKPTTPHP